jgi:hypothetical protein
MRLTKKEKKRIVKTYKTVTGQKRVMRLWQAAHDAYYWLEDYRQPILLEIKYEARHGNRQNKIKLHK